jgi:hypothetical protein
MDKAQSHVFILSPQSGHTLTRATTTSTADCGNPSRKDQTMSHTKPLMHNSCALALIALITLCASSQAAQQQQAPQTREQGQGGEHQHRKPPPEALDACKGKSSGQACSFTSPHGQVDGTCFAPEDKPQACRPKHPPQHDGDHGDGQGPDHQQGGASRPPAKR